MAYTRLSLSATPGKRYSGFTGKPWALKGVLRSVAADVYIPGVTEAEVYIPGISKAEVYVPGGSTIQTEPV